MNDFLSGPLAAQVKSHPALHDFSAKVFDVMEERRLEEHLVKTKQSDSGA